MKRFAVFCSSLMWLLSACTSNPDDEGTSGDNTPAPNTHAALSSLLTEASTRYGVVIHGVPYSRDIPGATVLKGDTESFVNFNQGMSVMAWSSPEAPRVLVGPPSTIEEHDDMARVYFDKVGIPSGEMGKRYHFTGYAGGAAPGSEVSGDQKVIGFSTSFARAIGGLEVVDSIASVQLARTGEPIGVSIRWPAGPDSAVLREAERLQQLLRDQKWSLSLSAGRVEGVTSTSVVYRHSIAPAPLRWAAVVRLELGGSRVSFRDFDADGRELRFDDAAPSPNASRNKPAQP